MSIFTDMNDDFFANRDLVDMAVYFENGAGVGVTVPIYLNETEIESNIGGFTGLSTGRALEIRISDIPIVREGDVFEFKGGRHRVKSDPPMDKDGLNWLVELGG